jgi:hypothetical protein
MSLPKPTPSTLLILVAFTAISLWMMIRNNGSNQRNVVFASIAFAIFFSLAVVYFYVVYIRKAKNPKE